MAELTAQERLQPSLLDRLTDDAPDRSVEARDQRVFSVDRLRESVLRDLAWLLNTGNLQQLNDLEDYPHVTASVVNYGIPDLAGSLISRSDLGHIEGLIREAVLTFEPRILSDTVKVRAVWMDENDASHSAVKFEIEGDLWSQPLPLKLYLSTTVDLESGQVVINKQGA